MKLAFLLSLVYNILRVGQQILSTINDFLKTGKLKKNIKKVMML